MKIEEILVIGVMPFLYGAATRLPFIYFVIHLVSQFNLEMWTIGIYVALYQGSRVITSAASIVMPKMSHFMGNSIGLAGFLTVLLSDNQLLTPFVAGTAVVGFSETMSSMQGYAKKMYEMEADRDRASKMLKYQYASVMVGVVFAFSIGGFVYQYYFINGVALFGVIIQSLGLASFLLYLGLTTLMKDKSSSQVPLPERDDKEADAIHAEDKKNEASDTLRQSQISVIGSMMRGSLLLKRGTTLTRAVNKANANFDTDEEIAATWINWIMVLSFGIEALTIGYNLSIGPIFLLDEFDKQTGIIGIMFAVGAASGTIAAVGVTCTNIGRRLLRKIATSPFDICFAMLGIGIGVLVAAVPTFPVHVAGVVLLMCFNDLGATLMTELQASISTTSNFGIVGPMGQVVRRTLNCVTALTGPLFFGIYPRLPYFVAGGVTLIWTAGLFMAFKFRLQTTVKAIAESTGHSRGTVAARMQAGDINFITTEVLHTSTRFHAAAKEPVPKVEA